MVQTRWEHMNRDHSLLTSIQALMLDGHHMVENRARFGAGNMFNFSGTGGMWRRQASRTRVAGSTTRSTEDLDLSYRAQLAGWRFVYRGERVDAGRIAGGHVVVSRAAIPLGEGHGTDCAQALAAGRQSELTLAQRIEACFHMFRTWPTQ